MSKFKVNDRVAYYRFGSLVDSGIIKEKYTPVPGKWWVTWDSDGETLHIAESDIVHEATEMPKVLTINGFTYTRQD